MHICHLSLYPDAFCSILLDLTDDQKFLPGNSRDARLHQLWVSYRKWCEEGGYDFCPKVFPPRKITMFTIFFTTLLQSLNPEGVSDRAAKKLFSKEVLLPGAGKYPEPSQKVISASASRYFIFWSSHVMNEFLKKAGDNATQYMLHLVMNSMCLISFFFRWARFQNKNKFLCGRAVWSRYQAAILGSLATMEYLSLKEGRLLSDRSCTEYKTCYMVYRSSLNWLAHENVELGKCRFHIRPKVHQFGHLVYNFLPLNPRGYSNYLDEDYICKTKHVAQACHPLHMPLHVAMRYSIAVCLRWDGALQWKQRSANRLGTIGFGNSTAFNQFYELYLAITPSIPIYMW